MKDTLHFDAQDKLKAGIDKVAKAVGQTMGTGGSNTVIEAIENPGYLTTNDGYSIANAIMLADPIEDLGRKMLLEAINRANKVAGDGSSSTCVLTRALNNEGLDYIKSKKVKWWHFFSKTTEKVHPMDIKRSIEECMPIVESQLEAQTEYIVTDGVIDIERLEQVATVSAENSQIGKMITDIYSQIGPKGVINWDISKTIEDSYTIGTGITVEGATYISPYMCDATETGQNTNQIRLKNPHILLTKQKITSAADFNNIALALNTKEIKDLIVFADDYEPLIVNDLILTRAKQGFRIVVIKMPVFWKDWWFEDLAIATGATVIDATAGLPMKQATLEHLGKVGNIVIDKQDSFLDGIKDVSEHIKTLEAEDNEEGDLRAARLNTKTARYFVGAQSESALSYRRLKVEDAISAAYQALNGGIVAGGGSALAGITLPDTVGGQILARAIKAPAKQIAENAGYPDMVIGADYDGTHGFNTKTGEFVDMFEEGIVDPKNVVLNAVKNAISVAATVITAPTIVLLPRVEEVQQVNPNLIVR